MVDNAWRDSFVIKRKIRLEREENTGIEEEDNSTLLELEKKANLAKPSGGDGMFAGTSFEQAVPAPNSQSQLIRSGLTMYHSNTASNFPVEFQSLDDDTPTVFDHEREKATEREVPQRLGRGKSMYNRATAALDTFAERLASSSGSQRKSSKDESDREKSVDMGELDRRKSAHRSTRVKSVVTSLAKSVVHRKAKESSASSAAPSEIDIPEPESMLNSDNPSFAHKLSSVNSTSSRTLSLTGKS